MQQLAQLRHPERWSRVLGWATLVGIELGVIGPFGTYAASPFNRIIYWTGLCWLGALLLWPSVVVAIVRGRARGVPPLFAGGATLLAACMPLAVLAALACGLFWPKRASGMHAAEWYVLTLLVAAPITAVVLWLERTRPPVPSMPVPLAQTGGPIGEHVPAHSLAVALCLQMEDHYVRVHLAGGSSLHLGSLRETAARLEEGRGLQVHRSWWVAREAVMGWTEDGRSVALLLANGLRVPVARSRVAHLRQAKWLDTPRCVEGTAVANLP